MSERFTPAQQRAVAALMTSRDTRTAAKAAGVGPRTLYRWLADPAFKAALRAAQDAALESATRRLVDAAAAAVDVLKAVMADGSAPHAARIRAADVVLGRLMDLRQLVDFEARLSALERQVGLKES